MNKMQRAFYVATILLLTTIVTWIQYIYNKDVHFLVRAFWTLNSLFLSSFVAYFPFVVFDNTRFFSKKNHAIQYYFQNIMNVEEKPHFFRYKKGYIPFTTGFTIVSNEPLVLLFVFKGKIRMKFFLHPTTYKVDNYYIEDAICTKKTIQKSIEFVDFCTMYYTEEFKSIFITDAHHDNKTSEEKIMDEILRQLLPDSKNSNDTLRSKQNELKQLVHTIYQRFPSLSVEEKHDIEILGIQLPENAISSFYTLSTEKQKEELSSITNTLNETKEKLVHYLKQEDTHNWLEYQKNLKMLQLHNR